MFQSIILHSNIKIVHFHHKAKMSLILIFSSFSEKNDIQTPLSKFCSFNYWNNMLTKINVRVYIQSVRISYFYHKTHILNIPPNLKGTETSIIKLDWCTDTPMYLLFQCMFKYVIEFRFMLLAHYLKN